MIQLFRRTHTRRGRGDHIEVVLEEKTLCDREVYDGVAGDWPYEGMEGYERRPLLKCCRTKGERLLAELQDVLKD